MSVEVARLVSLVRAVGAGVAPLARVRQQVAPQEEALVGALEHLAAHAAHAAAARAALLLQSNGSLVATPTRGGRGVKGIGGAMPVLSAASSN